MIELIKGYGFYILLGVLLIHILFASLLSREVLVWVPAWNRKLKLLLLIWLVPVKGLKWANKKAQLGWNEERRDTVGGSSVGMGLLEIDAVFNPGAKNRIEAIQEQKVTVVKKNGQGYDQCHSDLSSISGQPDNKD